MLVYRYGAVQVNYNYRARKHIDKNNLGPSYICSLGDHTGGKVACTHTTIKLRLLYSEQFKIVLLVYMLLGLVLFINAFSFPRWTTGALWTGDRGTLDCSKGAWKLFDGNTLHATEPYEGM